MEQKTELVLDDFFRDTLLKDQDDPFFSREKLELGIERYKGLYKDYEEKISLFFGYFHFKLNSLFEFWNTKFRSDIGGHFNAVQSRELIFFIDSFKQIFNDLKNSADEITVSKTYQELMDKIYPLLCNVGGSPIPVEFGKIEIVKHEPIFTLTKSVTGLISNNKSYKLTFVGEGSYAIVKKYFNQDYNRWFAIKQAKNSLSEKELIRFKHEYEILSGIKFPYILDVFSYDLNKNAYTMEYCDFSLLDYITINNQKLNLETRKKIALQFLYGVNYLHKKGYLHRDLSWNNVLIKKYDFDIVYVKISDFGLVKDEHSEITDSDSSGKGSTFHKDPLRETFKDIKIENEVYSVGCVLNFIFTGRQNLTRSSKLEEVCKIVDKCTDNRSLNNRYHNILDIISDVEKIKLKKNT